MHHRKNYTCIIMLYNFFLPVKSFVALVQFVFTIPGVNSFLSEKLCQDPLENFLAAKDNMVESMKIQQ